MYMYVNMCVWVSISWRLGDGLHGLLGAHGAQRRDGRAARQPQLAGHPGARRGQLLRGHLL